MLNKILTITVVGLCAYTSSARSPNWNANRACIAEASQKWGGCYYDNNACFEAYENAKDACYQKFPLSVAETKHVRKVSDKAQPSVAQRQRKNWAANRACIAEASQKWDGCYYNNPDCVQGYENDRNACYVKFPVSVAEVTSVKEVSDKAQPIGPLHYPKNWEANRKCIAEASKKQVQCTWEYPELCGVKVYNADIDACYEKFPVSVVEMTSVKKVSNKAQPSVAQRKRKNWDANRACIAEIGQKYGWCYDDTATNYQCKETYDRLLSDCYARFPVSVAEMTSVEEVSDYEKVQGMSWNVAGTMSLVKQFEGLRLNAYQDSVGVWTIGYGHTGSDVKPGMTITQAKADQLLQNDLAKFNACVTSSINKPLNPNQVGALMSFSFNVGCGALEGSTLRRRINAGENPNLVASQELPKWDKAGGKTLPGLTKRRAAEVAFFKS